MVKRVSVLLPSLSTVKMIGPFDSFFRYPINIPPAQPGKILHSVVWMSRT